MVSVRRCVCVCVCMYVSTIHAPLHAASPLPTSKQAKGERYWCGDVCVCPVKGSLLKRSIGTVPVPVPVCVCVCVCVVRPLTVKVQCRRPSCHDLVPPITCVSLFLQAGERNCGHMPTTVNHWASYPPYTPSLPECHLHVATRKRQLSGSTRAS